MNSLKLKLKEQMDKEAQFNEVKSRAREYMLKQQHENEQLRKMNEQL